jgi:hypothetical protein
MIATPAGIGRDTSKWKGDGLRSAVNLLAEEILKIYPVAGIS